MQGLVRGEHLASAMVKGNGVFVSDPSIDGMREVGIGSLRANRLIGSVCWFVWVLGAICCSLGARMRQRGNDGRLAKRWSLWGLGCVSLSIPAALRNVGRFGWA